MTRFGLSSWYQNYAFQKGEILEGLLGTGDDGECTCSSSSTFYAVVLRSIQELCGSVGSSLPSICTWGVNDWAFMTPDALLHDIWMEVQLPARR